MAEKYLYCEDLVEAFSYNMDDCCSSCHSEFEGDYNQPTDWELKDGRFALTCCGSNKFLTEKELLK